MLLDTMIQDTLQVHLTIHGPQLPSTVRQYIMELIAGVKVEDVNAAIVDLIQAKKLGVMADGRIKAL